MNAPVDLEAALAAMMQADAAAIRKRQAEPVQRVTAPLKVPRATPRRSEYVLPRALPRIRMKAAPKLEDLPAPKQEPVKPPREEALARGRAVFEMKQREKTRQRNETIVAMLHEGKSRDEIAAHLGRSRAHIDQIIQRVAPEFKVKPEEMTRRLVEGRLAKQAERKAEVQEHIAAMVRDSAAYSVIRETLGLSVSSLTAHLSDMRQSGKLTVAEIKAVQRLDFMREHNARRDAIRALMDEGLHSGNIPERLGMSRSNVLRIMREIKDAGWQPPHVATAEEGLAALRSAVSGVLDKATEAQGVWIIDAATMDALREAMA